VGAGLPVRLHDRRQAIKIAPMSDEYTRASLLHVLERSIAAERLITKW
jgi:hypothetical protein